MSAFGLMPDGADAGAQPKRKRRAQWRDADVGRAIAAAQEAGLESYRVDIAPDGTISIVVGASKKAGGPKAEP